MKSVNRRVRFARRAGAVFASLLFLSGCVAVAPAKKDVTQPPAQAVPGQRGFNVTDNSRIEPQAQADFDAAVVALNAGEIEKGIELLEKVTRQSPNAVAPYVNLAIAYKELDKLELAEEQLKTATRLNPDHPVANNEYGMLYRKTGRFAEAKTVYEKIIAKYPDYQPARKNLGVLCDIYLKDPECALQQYEIYSAATPGDKQVKLWIADLQRRLGK